MPAFAQTKVKVTTQVNETISAVKTIKNPESKVNVRNVFFQNYNGSVTAEPPFYFASVPRLIYWHMGYVFYLLQIFLTNWNFGEYY